MKTITKSQLMILLITEDTVYFDFSSILELQFSKVPFQVSKMHFLTNYSEHDWKIYRFEGNVPAKYWTKQQNLQKYLDSLAKKLNITNMEDWYKVMVNQYQEIK